MRKLTVLTSFAIALGIIAAVVAISVGLASPAALADNDRGEKGSKKECKDLPSHSELAAALSDA